jgi:hypothetical protein
MPRTFLTATAVWALAVCSLAACSSGTKTASSTTAPPSSSPTTAAASSTPTKSVAKSYTKADLDAALLAVSDLPAGYTFDKDMASGDSVMSSCTDEAIALDSYRAGATAKTGTAFTKTNGQIVAQSLAVLSGDVANNTLAALKKAVARCTTWTVTSSTYTLTKADYGPYGDEAFSYRVTVKTDVPWAFAVVFIRKANLLAGVMVGAMGTGTIKDAQGIFAKAAGKLPK